MSAVSAAPATSDVSVDNPVPLARDGDVAVVGVGVRLPGGIRTLDGLWEALTEGRDLVGEVPGDRFDVARFVSADGRAHSGRTYTAAGGFLDDVASFDAEFFGISPKEASRLDPQQRLLLECAVEAFGDAGIDPAALAGGDAAVIVGVSSHGYGDLQQRRPRTMNAYTMSGTASCNTANRVSYVFDLRGASFAVDTACSSTLTAVHQACQEVRSGRSALALTGGVSVLLNPGESVGFAQASMLSPSGRCRPFSERADGYVRSEGAGVLVLKPLTAALADGDRVHGVILGSGVNADGRTAGLALPSARSQAALLARVYAEAGVGADEVGYVEAHGTGTQAGDPVECAALGEVLGRRRTSGVPLPIGSVKSNLGHLEAAAGVPGLLKALLVLRERRIPATLHTVPPSSRIDFARLGLEPVAEACLVPGERPVAGVNSFGFGGANAHVVLGAAPDADDPRRPGRDGAFPLVLSARTPQALEAAAVRWAEHLEGLAPDAFHDTAYTACRRQARYEQRVALLAEDPSAAARALRRVARGEPAPGAARGVGVERGRIALVFSGNGSQWAGMGAELLGADGDFTAEVDAVDEVLRPLLGWSVREEMAAPRGPEVWQRTEIAQPMLFALQAGLVAALTARGFTPAAVCGHSVGEVAAAYCAGALDRGAACRVIAARSRAQGGTAGCGRMAAVGLGSSEAEKLIAETGQAERLVVAGVNSARDVTVAGDAEALAGLGEVLGERGVFFRDLGLDHAFHSPAMDALCGPLATALSGLPARPARIPLASTVTGRLSGGAALDADYWWRNVRAPVRFAEAVDALVGEAGCDVLVEIGPHPVLGAYLRRGTADAGRPVAVIPTLTRTAAGPGALDSAVAQLLACGAETDWSVPFPQPGRVVDVPAYPWQRERHWNGGPGWWEETAAEEDGESARPPHALLGVRQPGARPAWWQELSRAAPVWSADHLVGETVVVPAAGYADMALTLGQAVHDAPVEVLGLSISRALSLPGDDEDRAVSVHTVLERDGAFTVSGRDGSGGAWTEHARGRVRRLLRACPPGSDPNALRSRLPRELSAADHYALCARAGLPYGPAFRTLTGLRVDAGDGREVLACYAATVDLADAPVAHPTLLDGALQAGLPLLTPLFAPATDRQPALPDRKPAALDAAPAAYLPVGIDTLRCWQPLPRTGLIHVRLRARTAREALWDLTVMADDGTVALEALGCRLRRFDATHTPAPQQLAEVLRAAPLPTSPSAPSPWPTPADTLAACTDALARAARGWRNHPYDRARAHGLRLNAHLTVAAVRELLPDTREFSLDDLIAAGVLPRHRRLLTALFEQAAREGVLTGSQEGGRWRVAEEPQPHRLFREVLLAFPAEAAAAHAYGVCGLHLADVLRGRTDPLTLLFAEPDALAARFYDSTPVMHHHYRTARLLLEAAVAAWPEERPLRVLEVGAGTGGLTAALLPCLPPDRTHYTYSDVSSAFFPAAQERFADHDFVHHRCLDLDADPAAQGFTPASYDLVVAANVLHATRDLRRTLHRIGDLLADGGQLLAIESHDPAALTPVFGLLDSYWSAEDTELRPGGPLLARDRWPGLLRACGYTGTVQPGDATQPAYDDHSVILTTRGPRPTPATASPGPGPGRPPAVADLTGGPLAVAAAAALGGGARPASESPRRWAELLADTDDVVLLADADALRAAANGAEAGTESATEIAVRHCAVLRALATATRQVTEDRAITVWLVVCGALDIPPSAAAAVWGAARSLANEQPRLTVRRIALAAGAEDRLAEEMAVRPADDEVLLRREGRFVTRLRPYAPRPVTAPTAGEYASYTLTLDEPGLRYRLGWRPACTPRPKDGEIVVEVAAAALNYHDVMAVTGLVRPPQAPPGLDAEPIGLECAGTVVAVGAGVERVAVGDRVACPTLGCYGSHVRVRADRVMPVPDGMDFTEAATLPTVFLTVQHALDHQARLRCGETVLVHGAAGGVGLAALQYARHVGARVIATAGTPGKRDLLRLLGVEHVLDSRTLRFADEVDAITEGRGVDVVLNSLAGEAMERGLRVLAPHGRFVELGKRDFFADNSLALAPFRHNLSFHGVDVAALLTEDSPASDAHLTEITRAVHAGDYRPPAHRVHPAARIREAFAALQHSRHIGKVVITFDPAEPVPVRPAPTPVVLDPEASYLVTGGLGGFGAATARHLAARGARHLILVGRRGADTPGAAELTADLAALGVRVSAYAADAADRDAMRRVLDDLDVPDDLGDLGTERRRLAGVVHAAMVLDDAPLHELDDARVRAVLAPKVTAGQVLDELTRDRPLDFFVVYSSGAAVAGNLAQSSYAAANLALEAVVRDRRRAGLPGLAVQWGAIAEAGYVHRSGRGDEMTALGLGGLATAEAFAVLDRLLADPDATAIAVGHFDWGRLHRFLHNLAAPRTAALLPPAEHTDGADRLRQALERAEPDDAAVLVEDVLADLLAQVLQTTPDHIDRTRRLDQLGVDSLLAAELATLLRQRLGCELPTVELAGTPNLSALARRVLSALPGPG
ncbi:SDR family NAD(P)-dependent oxidoreductase [Streptomyces cyaneochromogenes]|uniref:SDR family NAD(P)-dependent oxidoreductase n=1 Tax=Streptomyces cyaneochromogenes TaxID=2496836 RepID=A0A3Q9EMA4_9ACTN|nr:type I polyketide synthase [Streptomyces cyaneochromogenes]AZQ34043.1 SDR family NAD(P)-dependent oxidoreductase [Streptomyces cyaneochromogenes]